MQHGRRRPARARAGATILAAATLGLGGLVGPTWAQDAGGEGDPPAGESVTAEKVAIYQFETTGTLPRTLTSEVPPGAVCVVEPAFCPEQAEPVGGALVGAVKTVQEGEPASPQPAVAPGTIAVQILGGTPYRHAGVLVPFPAVPEGEALTSFVLRMPEVASQTYHSNSPAFRQAVLAALASVGARAPSQEEFGKVVGESPLDTTPINVEACPFVAPMGDGVDQTEEQIPEFDCLFGTNAQRGEDGVWTFDLGFAAAAWSSGDLPYEGIYIRPAKAQNVAYGDPDPSTQARVTWDITQMTLEAQSATPPEPPAALDFGAGGFDSGASAGGASAGGSSGFGGGTTSGGSSGGSGFSSGGFSAPSGSGGFDSVSSPGLSAPTEPNPDVAGSGGGGFDTTGGETLAAEPVAAETPSAWYVWLLVPMFMAGAWFTTRALEEETAVAAAATGREGAMSRLIAFQSARAAEDEPTRVDLRS